MARKVLVYGKVLVGVVALLAVGIVTVSVVLRLAHGQDAGSALTPEQTAAEVHRLRVDAQDPNGARALAGTFLAGYATPDIWRQLVEFENAMTYRDQNNFTAAVPLFQQIVATYATADFATGSGVLADPNVVVDDAQYYVAALQEPTGDVAAVTAAYGALFNGFPDSNRTAQALLRFGGFLFQNGDPNGAGTQFQALVARFPGSPQAPEAQIQVANVCLAHNDYVGAAAAFEAVANGWSDSPHAPVGLQSAVRALITDEQLARQPQPGKTVASDVNHSAAIMADVDRILTNYPQADFAAGIGLDAINYLARGAVLHAVSRGDADQGIIALAQRVEQVAPDARATAWVKLNEAVALCRANPARASALVQDVLARAQAGNDDQMLTDAQSTSAELYSRQGQFAEARALWAAILQRPQSPLFEGEVKTAIGFSYLRAGDTASAATALLEVANSDKYSVDVRTTAQVCAALALGQSGQTAEALAQLDQAIAAYPDTTTAAAATHLRERLVRQLHP